MSGMRNEAHELHLKALGYDDAHVATEDSRRMYGVLFNMPADLGRWIRLDGTAISVSKPMNPAIAAGVDDVTECIARAMYTSAQAVKRQRTGARILGVDEETFRAAMMRSKGLHMQMIGRAVPPINSQWELRDGKLNKKPGAA